MGYYNLPKEQQDQYNQEPTQEELRASWEKTKKAKIKITNKLIHALSQETLSSFAQRMDVVDEQLTEQAIQEHMYGPKGPWYVHKRSANCFICDLITNNEQKSQIIHDLTKLLPKSSTLRFRESPTGTNRLAKR